METIDDCVLPVAPPARIEQGFHGKYSHQIIEDGDKKFDESYALDFLVPEGSLVFAARPGCVAAIKVDSNLNYFPKVGEEEDPTKKKEAINAANYIIIKHDDGTFALYVHLRKDGIASVTDNGQQRPLRVGDNVQAGQEIGKSGNTGYSSEPHLHFSVTNTNSAGFVTQTLPIKFTNYAGPLEDRELHPARYRAASK